MMEECPVCGREGVKINSLHESGKNKSFVCIFCKNVFEQCSSCGGTGCGDYPYPCYECTNGIGCIKK